MATSNILSSSLNDIGKFLTSAATDPNAPATIKTALADVTAAVHSVEAAMEDAIDLLVDTEINALISKIPVLGNLAQPEIDALANDAVHAVLVIVYAKLGLAPPAPVVATVAPIAPTTGVQSNLIAALASGQG
jgi:hypothetical protein